jgi:hypothetical protein
MEGYIWVAWPLTIISWAAVPFANHYLTIKRDKRSERNKTIDAIESLFEKMNQEFLLFVKDKEFDLALYHGLISKNQQLRFLLKRIISFDNEIVMPGANIRKIRKLTTNDDLKADRKIELMRELLSVQLELLQKLPKTF